MDRVEVSPPTKQLAGIEFDQSISNPLTYSQAQSETFLQMLDLNTSKFEFRTFDDVKGRNNALLGRKFSGELKDHAHNLQALNGKGAGVFVVINEGGQTKLEITRVRAVFADTDGAPLEPLLSLKPHMVIESSPSNWHVYWLVDADFTLDMFTPIQMAIAKKYGTDSAVKDLSRVMRLPGFFHNKGTPSLTNLDNYDKNLPRYSLEKIITGLSLDLSNSHDASAPLINNLFPVERLGSNPAEKINDPYPFTPQNAAKFLSAAKVAHPNIREFDDFRSWGFECCSLVMLESWPESEVKLIFDMVCNLAIDANTDENDELWAKYLDQTLEKVKSGGTENLTTYLTTLKNARAKGWLPENAEITNTALTGKFALISIGSKVGIIDNGQAKLASTLNPLSVYSKEDGGLIFKRHIKSINPNADANKAFAEWLVSPNTPVYQGIELNPAKTSSGYLNLWHGMSVTPKQGEYTLIHGFILEVICNNSSELFDYVYSWLAHMIQRPEEKPGISLLLLGGQGIGKGTFAAKIVGALYADHFLHLQTDKPLTGDHNQSLESSYYIFADEAFFSGDKKAANILKAIETESRLYINPKYQAGRQIVSYHRIISASNSDHAADVEYDDRRKVVLRVSDAHKGDWAYWNALDNEINNGGLEAFAFALQQADISIFQVRDKPNTGELLKQKLASLDFVSRWWADRLMMGCQSINGIDWLDFVSTQSLYAGFIEFHKSQNSRGKTPNMQEFVEKLKALCPNIHPAQPGSGHTRKRGFNFPPLNEARTAFEIRLGGAISWD